MEDPVTVEYITCYIAILTLMTPPYYQPDPWGTYHTWKANVIGWGTKSVCEFLEKSYTDDAIETDDLIIKLVTKALWEAVQS
ncbi:hypothetical protein A6R68_02088, partial [Neotoma lepida]